MKQIFKPHYLWRPTQAFRRLSQALFPRQPGPMVVELPWGVPLCVDPGEEIGHSIWQLGLYDLAVSETLWRLIEPGDLVLDVGANIGYMSGLMARCAGPSGEVRAYEPHPRVFADLQDNVRRFREDPDLAAVRAFPVALSDAAGTALLYCSERFAGNRGLASLSETSGLSVSVATTTLDEVLGARSAALVKIDVEGNEARVLAGGREALGSGRVRHIIYEAFTAEKDALAEMLQRYGYTVFSLGWRFFGPLLTAGAAELPGYEPPNCVATLDPGVAISRLQPRGWRVLSRSDRHKVGPGR